MVQTSQDLKWTSYNSTGESFASRETKTADKQMDLFSEVSHLYDCIATNEFAKPEEGKYFTDSHKFYMRAKNVFCDPKIYALIYNRIDSLRSWVLVPPEFP